MYKGTRHTRALWIYRSPAQRKAGMTNDSAFAILSLSRTFLFETSLLSINEYPTIPKLNKPDEYVQYVEQRLKKGSRYLQTRGLPDYAIAYIPEYVIVAPQLNLVIKRLRHMHASQVPTDLCKIHGYLISHPERSQSRITEQAVALTHIKTYSAEPARTALQIAFEAAISK